jgi:cyclic pyranopterin phosphate synthase
MGASERPPPIAPAEAWWRDSYMVTFAFRCNLGCSFCMVEDALDVYAGTPLDELRRLIRDEPERFAGRRRIIFSGGEVTLSEELCDYARAARAIPGVEHVRLQTNATRLARRDLLRALRDAGVDEFFVSLHGHDEETCDALTRRKGSFRAILDGIEAIAASGATWITNTAIVRPNAAHLPRIVERVAPLGPHSMEFWNYWPRGDEHGARELVAPVAEVRPALLEALAACVARGIPPVVKWFPRCLLGDFAWCQDDGQPPALIEDVYWEREPAYACLYEGVCADAGTVCSGLSHAYIERHGWEESLLAPRRTGPRRLDRSPARSLVDDAAPERREAEQVTAWLARRGVTAAGRYAGYRLVACARAPDRATVRARFERAGEQVELELRRRDAAGPAAVLAPHLDPTATREGKGRHPGVAALVRALAEALASPS